MSTSPRNEVRITLAGTERVMRPTFGVMVAIERDLKKPWAQLGQMVLDGTYGINDIATIIHHGLKGFGDTRLTFEQVGEAVATEGLNEMVKPVIELISIGFQGVKDVGKSAAEASPPQ
jgi:hypothetical protein